LRRLLAVNQLQSYTVLSLDFETDCVSLDRLIATFGMAQEDPRNHLEEDICIHLFTVSSAMVGVCLTVIGLIRVVITLGKVDTIADDLLALDAFLFLIASILSYSALRTRSARRMRWVERVADRVFIMAMILMTVVCACITYAISASGK
jgi:predicted membrane channel-forming protein YqfA (hemolysin III family)